MWYGAQVLRFDPEGNVERGIPLPVSQVSSVAFGGKDLATLYITTAAEPWPSELEPPGFDWDARPAGGALYACRPGVAGKLDHFADFGPE
jgi:sugar lactone lactonase YvrE